jgi:hypothetical protein
MVSMVCKSYLQVLSRMTYAAVDLANDTRLAAAVRSGVDEAALTRGLNVRASGAMICGGLEELRLNSIWEAR